MGPFLLAAIISTASMVAQPTPVAAPAAPAVQVFAQASFTPPQAPDSRPTWRQRPPFMPPPSTPRYEGNRTVRTVVVTTVAGMLTGALIGYAMNRDCACDSPGMAGLMYGGMIGTGAGAAFGFLISR
jgi:hypothetical protein